MSTYPLTEKRSVGSIIKITGLLGGYGPDLEMCNYTYNDTSSGSGINGANTTVYIDNGGPYYKYNTLSSNNYVGSPIYYPANMSFMIDYYNTRSYQLNAHYYTNNRSVSISYGGTIEDCLSKNTAEYSSYEKYHFAPKYTSGAYSGWPRTELYLLSAKREYTIMSQYFNSVSWLTNFFSNETIDFYARDNGADFNNITDKIFLVTQFMTNSVQNNIHALYVKTNRYYNGQRTSEFEVNTSVGYNTISTPIYSLYLPNIVGNSLQHVNWTVRHEDYYKEFTTGQETVTYSTITQSSVRNNIF